MIDTVWDELRADAARTAGVVRRRIAPNAIINLFAAVEHPSGTPLLLVELSAGAIPFNYTAPAAVGFSMTVSPGAEGSVQIELRLLEADGESVFRSFVDAVVDGVSVATDDRTAFQALILSVHTWQEFFKQYGACGLSAGAQQGLFGELWTLHEVLAQALSFGCGVDMWVGPAGANQDFELAGYALEVKTSTSNPLKTIKISNLRQLDDTCLRLLRLVLVEAERHANGDRTLPWMVHTVRQQARESAPHRLARLNELLTDAGYLDRDEPRYSSVAYAVRGIRCFEVSESFPRLTESTVPAGVGNVEYSLSLEALSRHEIDLNQLRAELGALNADTE